MVFSGMTLLGAPDKEIGGLGTQQSTPQAFSIRVPKRLARDLSRVHKAVLLTGPKPILHLDKRSERLVIRPASETHQLYATPQEDTREALFVANVSHVLAIEAAKEVVAGASLAEEKLKASMASYAEGKESNKTTLIDAKDVVMNGLKRPRAKALAKPVPAWKKSNYMSSGVSQSLPSSPGLGASFSPGASSAPETQPPIDAQALRSKAERFVLVHYLGVCPRTEDEISKATQIAPNDLKKSLDRIATRVPKDNGAGSETLWKLENRYFRDLNPWSFAYTSDADRVAAIDSAVSAFDRQRIPPEDEIWQRLLKPGDRGKGKILSRLRLDNGVGLVSGRPTNPRPVLTGAGGETMARAQSNGTSNSKKAVAGKRKKAIESESETPLTGPATKTSAKSAPASKGLKDATSSSSKAAASPALQSTASKKQPAKRRSAKTSTKNFKSAEMVISDDEGSSDIEEAMAHPGHAESWQRMKKRSNESSTPTVAPVKPATTKAIAKPGVTSAKAPAEKKLPSTEVTSGLAKTESNQNGKTNASTPNAKLGSKLEKPVKTEKHSTSAKMTTNTAKLQDVSQQTKKTNSANTEKRGQPNSRSENSNSKSGSNHEKKPSTDRATVTNAPPVKGSVKSKPQMVSGLYDSLAMKKTSSSQSSSSQGSHGAPKLAYKLGSSNQNDEITEKKTGAVTVDAKNGLANAKRKANDGESKAGTSVDNKANGAKRRKLGSTTNLLDESISVVRPSKESALLARKDKHSLEDESTTVEAKGTAMDDRKSAEQQAYNTPSSQSSQSSNSSHLKSFKMPDTATVPFQALAVVKNAEKEAWSEYFKMRMKYEFVSPLSSKTIEEMKSQAELARFLTHEVQSREEAVDATDLPIPPDSIPLDSAAYFARQHARLLPVYESLLKEVKSTKSVSEKEKKGKELSELRAQVAYLEQIYELASRKEMAARQKLIDAEVDKADLGGPLALQQALELYDGFFEKYKTYQGFRERLEKLPEYPAISQENLEKDVQMYKSLREMRRRIFAGFEKHRMYWKNYKWEAVQAGDYDKLPTELEAYKLATRLHFSLNSWDVRYNKIVSGEFGTIHRKELDRFWGDFDELLDLRKTIIAAVALDFGKKTEARVEDVKMTNWIVDNFQISPEEYGLIGTFGVESKGAELETVKE